MARKLGSPTLSRLRVWRDLEIENKDTNTGLGLGLVAQVNQVELGLVMVYDGGYVDSDWWWYINSYWWWYMDLDRWWYMDSDW